MIGTALLLLALGAVALFAHLMHRRHQRLRFVVPKGHRRVGLR